MYNKEIDTKYCVDHATVLHNVSTQYDTRYHCDLACADTKMRTLTNYASVYAIHPKRKQMKRQQRRATVSGAIGGSIVGGAVLGPVGAIVGGVGGAVATRKMCKRRERRRQGRFEQRQFQDQALEARGQSTGKFV
mmetsp:Transcript_28504/g.37966  ORF Transcript_28504/g.37966 Transcript_28504/m.37966 type:complete len:135 (-) Transcript_28504:156-560(-)